MKKRFSDEQIICILREAEAGVSARKPGVAGQAVRLWPCCCCAFI